MPSQLLSITPDMTTLGKYLAGGLTIGAFGGKRELMSVFNPDTGGSLTHGGTFNNNEISMAAGVAALTEVIEPQGLREVNERGDRLRARLNSVFAESGLPMCVTGWGSLNTVHGTGGPVSCPADLKTADDRLKELLFFDLLDQGFYMARRGFIALSLEIDDSHVDELIAIVEAWSHEAKGFGV